MRSVFERDDPLFVSVSGRTCVVRWDVTCLCGDVYCCMPLRDLHRLEPIFVVNVYLRQVGAWC